MILGRRRQRNMRTCGGGGGGGGSLDDMKIWLDEVILAAKSPKNEVKTY